MSDMTPAEVAGAVFLLFFMVAAVIWIAAALRSCNGADCGPEMDAGTVELTTRCAWCRRYELGGVWVFQVSGPVLMVTHGICPECAALQGRWEINGKEETL